MKSRIYLFNMLCCGTWQHDRGAAKSSFLLAYPSACNLRGYRTLLIRVAGPVLRHVRGVSALLVSHHGFAEMLIRVSRLYWHPTTVTMSIIWFLRACVTRGVGMSHNTPGRGVCLTGDDLGLAIQHPAPIINENRTFITRPRRGETSLIFHRHGLFETLRTST